VLYTLQQILANRPPLLTVQHDTPMLDAFRLIIERRLGQLPVVDAAGQLVGIVSQQTLLGVYHMTGGKVSLLDLAVVDCMEPAQTLTPQDDLLAAVDRLRQRGVYAVVVVQEERPVGILTGKDMSIFFHSLFEGILLAERFERQLATAIRIVFPTDEAFDQALIAAFGPDKDDSTKPRHGGKGLTLSDMAYLVRDDDNWPRFEPLFGNRDYFRTLMDQARYVRNEMAHFRGHTDVVEMDTLRRTAAWLQNRLALFVAPTTAASEPVDAVQTLGDIVGGRKPPVCTAPDVPLREALRTMIENRFGQLPVVDEQGDLLGMLSQGSILRTYYHTEGLVDLLGLPVQHCTEPAVTLYKDDDLFRASDLLTQPGVYAPLVMEGDKPVGILTGKDMAHFFRSLFEGVILVERIETRLREQTAAAFPEAAALNEAARRAFGPSPRDPALAARNPKNFTFADQMLLMCDDDIWPVFEPVIGSRELFMQLMDRVRRVRNALMHFRGNLSASEQDTMRKAHTWLSQRPLAAPAPPFAPLEEKDFPARATGNNPYPKVMARKPRTLPAGEAPEA
jgi:CBS domain-containing protein